MEPIATMSFGDEQVNCEAPYSFNNMKLPDMATAEGKLIYSLSQTAAFRRLNDIRFLGALDYGLIERPNGHQGSSRFTREQHSIGVAMLASQYVEDQGLEGYKRLLCVAAAMLHDIGHSPFSHTMEPIFQEYFGIDHHKVTEDIITGNMALGSSLVAVLNDFSIDPNDIVDVLNGDDGDFGGFFSGPINFDTIEGILRSRNYLKMQSLGITPARVLTAAVNRENERDEQRVDDFWTAKDEIYNLVIRSKPGVLCDTLFQEVARQSIDNISASDFVSTESRMFHKLPLLRELLQRGTRNSDIRMSLPQNIPYYVRRFYVDHTSDFTARRDGERYRQTKFLDSIVLD